MRGALPVKQSSVSHHMDHPRRCGEHLPWLPNHAYRIGSSPQMRGAPDFPTIEDLDDRIIPADAGSTADVPDNGKTIKDHPRRCGEHSTGYTMELSSTGSSPQMRGAPRAHEQPAGGPGIIPADAGSTRTSTANTRRAQDHPRRCGEHTHPRLMSPSRSGSSPQMRGAHHRCAWPRPHPGIIPADAGSTPMRNGAMPRMRDHPRRCGEHCTRSASSRGR